MATSKDIINRIAFVLDASGSMAGREKDVYAVLAGQVDWLCQRGDEMDQENRVTIYTFRSDYVVGSWHSRTENKIDCVVFDMDVKRLRDRLKNGSLGDFYQASGGTPLIRATQKVLSDLALTRAANIYGDHAYLVFVITDGQETENRTAGMELARDLGGQPGNVTVACLVPNINCKLRAKDFGFPDGNIAVWDVNSATGVAEMGKQVTEAMSNYTTLRSQGHSRTGELFAPTKEQVDAAGLKPLPTDSYLLLTVIPTKGIEVKIPKKTILKSRPDGIKHVEIMDFVEAQGHKYVTGKTYYQVVKSEKIDGNKDVIVVDTETGLAYSGAQARSLVGLDQFSRRVKPAPVDKATGKQRFKIFVQSTSTNRLLEIHNSQVLIKTK